MIGIVGAGPGGLTAAVALRRAGLQVEVLEQASSVRPVGAGITLQVNAMRMLEAVDLARPVQEAGWPLLDGRVARADGTPLVRIVEPDGRGFGVAIHRGALSRILCEALPDSVIRLDARVERIEPDGTVCLADGTDRRYDAIIGADGLHSAVRTALFGEHPLRYSGYTCWRGIADHAGVDCIVERWGRGLRFGSVPIAEGQVYWFACENAPAGGHDGPDPVPELQRRFAGFEPLVQELIAATSTVMRHDLYDLPPLPRWTRDRATLLGDAAHPMTPNLGQGAGQAIEDALVLADRVATCGLPDGLEAYEAARRPRATSFVRRSRRMGAVAQWSNPVACFVRDQLTAWTPRSAIRRGVEELYAVDVPSL